VPAERNPESNALGNMHANAWPRAKGGGGKSQEKRRTAGAIGMSRENPSPPRERTPKIGRTEQSTPKSRTGKDPNRLRTI
jgi:hypothetical protein